MDAKQVRKHWQRALRSNLARTAELLRRRGPLNAGAVHDLRVALRRSRLLLQLPGKHHDRNRTKAFRAAARKIMDALAPVRDADVTLDRARAERASPALLTLLLRERTTCCRRAERKRKRLKSILRTARLDVAGKIDADKLSRCFRRWLEAMSARCLEGARTAGRHSISELHELRRDIRRWRYLRELLLSREDASRDGAIQGLIAAQEALGAIQDAEVALNSLQRCGRSREVSAMKRNARTRLEATREAALRELEHFASRPSSPRHAHPNVFAASRAPAQAPANSPATGM